MYDLISFDIRTVLLDHACNQNSKRNNVKTAFTVFFIGNVPLVSV